jgi:hypothetical protein
MEIAIDFDGTCVTHEYPKVGRDIGAAPVLKRLTENGHKLILFTMRSDGDKIDVSLNESGEIIGAKKGAKHLTDAVNWFVSNGIPLYGVQANPSQKYWTSSPKAYAQLYIDDAALGCPLKTPENGEERPYVDWDAVSVLLSERGLI